jgi:hypothetical protein
MQEKVPVMGTSNSFEVLHAYILEPVRSTPSSVFGKGQTRWHSISQLMLDNLIVRRWTNIPR